MENKDIQQVGIIGLGNMGRGMAQTLLRKGIKVEGVDLSQSACEKAEEFGVKITSIESLLMKNKFIILSLPKAEHVFQVSEQVLRFGKNGLFIVDTSTSTPEVSRKIFLKLQQKGITFIDAPVSGGPKGAENGTMTMVVGAKNSDFSKVKPLLQKMSSVQVNVGDCGAGNVVKICNNLLAAAHLITTAEAVSLATKAGVEPKRLLEGLNNGSGRSAVSEVNFPLWILNQAYDSGFTMGLMRKDIGLAKDLVEEEGLSLPLSEAIIQRWQESITLLADQQDFNEIVKMSDMTLFGGK